MMKDNSIVQFPLSRVLLTGGAGYIGSHTAVCLLKAGLEVVLCDNFSNSNEDVIRRIRKISNKSFHFVKVDVRDTVALVDLFREFKIDAVVHFAGSKAVGESVVKPIEYFDNNVVGTISLLKAMNSVGIRTLVFSSSATVYGEPQYLPLDESHPTKATSPYGRSKLHIEEMLLDIANSDSNWRVACLRYFNPAGAHESGLLGEDPNDTPNNLMPFIARVAIRKLDRLSIFGDNYATSDGTGVRDYVHVMDIADGHFAALTYLTKHAGWHAINLGAGRGVSVLQIVRAFELITGNSIPYEIVKRRQGDVAVNFADVKKAEKILDWKAKRSLDEICFSAWKFIEICK